MILGWNRSAQQGIYKVIKNDSGQRDTLLNNLRQRTGVWEGRPSRCGTSIKRVCHINFRLYCSLSLSLSLSSCGWQSVLAISGTNFMSFRQKMCLPHNGAPPHFSVNIRNHLNATFPGRWIRRGGDIIYGQRGHLT